ncbi:hypothetical protein [Streptomyces sp. G-G2]|uniref:hypothetical protein n=1 Tax=Streptomyces sp. G-G2 TaxID=3046201 RepID=UPI0024B88298|nr:hypothetical protein [Streptomyces sp. G-G2]MDJ0385856.1 hypothetical protein [Streptomyces sp. G-G2]
MVGLGQNAAVGQAAALSLLLWQLLVLSGWTAPLRLSEQLSPHWSHPRELAMSELHADWFSDLRDAVLLQGPGREYPWLFPTCAMVLYLLVRVGRLPVALQALLGTLIAAYGPVALVASAPSLLLQWPLTLVLVTLSTWSLYGLHLRS